MTENTKYSFAACVNPTLFRDYSDLMGHHQKQQQVTIDAVNNYNAAHNELLKAGTYRDIVEDYQSLEKDYIKKLLDAKNASDVERIRISYNDRFKKLQAEINAFEVKYNKGTKLALVSSNTTDASREALQKDISKVSALLDMVKRVAGTDERGTIVEGFKPALDPSEALKRHLSKEITFKEAGVLSFFESTAAGVSWTKDEGQKIFTKAMDTETLEQAARVRDQWVIWCKFLGIDENVARNS